MARILALAQKGVLLSFTFTRSFLKIAAFWDVTQFSLVVKTSRFLQNVLFFFFLFFSIQHLTNLSFLAMF